MGDASCTSGTWGVMSSVRFYPWRFWCVWCRRGGVEWGSEEPPGTTFTVTFIVHRERIGSTLQFGSPRGNHRWMGVGGAVC